MTHLVHMMTWMNRRSRTGSNLRGGLGRCADAWSRSQARARRSSARSRSANRKISRTAPRGGRGWWRTGSCIDPHHKYRERDQARSRTDRRSKKTRRRSRSSTSGSDCRRAARRRRGLVCSRGTARSWREDEMMIEGTSVLWRPCADEGRGLRDTRLSSCRVSVGRHTNKHCLTSSREEPYDDDLHDHIRKL